MLGKIRRVCCCRKRENADLHLTNQEDGQRNSVGAVDDKMNTEESGVCAPFEKEQCTDNGGPPPLPEYGYNVEKDLDYPPNGPVRKKKSRGLNELNLDEFIGCNDQFRGYLLMRHRRGMASDEEAEAQLAQGKEDVQNIKCEPSSQVHRCPGMNEILEMVRDGVSLRHIIIVQKTRLQSDGEDSEINSQAGPELYEMLKKRRVCSDSCASGVSEHRIPVVEASLLQNEEVFLQDPVLKRGPGQNVLCHDKEHVQGFKDTEGNLDAE